MDDEGTRGQMGVARVQLAVPTALVPDSREGADNMRLTSYLLSVKSLRPNPASRTSLARGPWLGRTVFPVTCPER